MPTLTAGQIYNVCLEAGFTPVEAVQIMTANGAKVLGADAEYGTIAAGKRADLVVIKGNPVASPAQIRRGVRVRSAKARPI